MQWRDVWVVVATYGVPAHSAGPVSSAHTPIEYPHRRSLTGDGVTTSAPAPCKPCKGADGIPGWGEGRSPSERPGAQLGQSELESGVC